jgi:hypothetical protein
MRLWDKLSDEEIEEIIKHTPEYVKSTPEKKYRKHPQTYLNNYCWEDEIIYEDEDDANPSEDYDLPKSTLEAMGL